MRNLSLDARVAKLEQGERRVQFVLVDGDGQTPDQAAEIAALDKQGFRVFALRNPYGKVTDRDRYP